MPSDEVVVSSIELLSLSAFATDQLPSNSTLNSYLNRNSISALILFSDFDSNAEDDFCS